MPDIFKEQAHGGVAIWGLDTHSELLDLSVNINPYGPPLGLLEALRQQSYRDYPDPEARRLREALATRYQCEPASLAIGNGANELLWAAARAFLKPGSNFACLEPCYSEFKRAALQVGARQEILAATPETYAYWTLDALSETLASRRVALLYLCNPNSPTGAYLQSELIIGLATRLPKLRIILDESFLSLSYFHEQYRAVYPSNVFRIVSLTKDFALAGLRLGYALGEAEAVAAIRAEIPTWSVNALALAAGLWALEHQDFLQQSRSQLLEDCDRLHAELSRRDIQVLASSTVFLMLKPAGAAVNAQRLLQKHSILVRSAHSYGWPDWWRIAARPAALTKRFLAALDEEIS